MLDREVIEKAIEICKASKYATVQFHPMSKEELTIVREVCKELNFEAVQDENCGRWKFKTDYLFGVTIFDPALDIIKKEEENASTE